MKRDTVKAYRARGKATHDAIDAELARQKAERDAAMDAARAKERADRKTEGTITIADFAECVNGSHLIRDQFGWRRVLKANPRSVTVPSLIKEGWTDTVRYEKIREVREYSGEL